MKVLILEDNLLWSSRLVKSLTALGHEPEVHSTPPAGTVDAQVAIINLASQGLRPTATVPALAAMGVHVIGHAGHKEKDLLELGRGAGCHTLATNSELTFKLANILERIESER
jgi:hypothetical protein